MAGANAAAVLFAVSALFWMKWNRWECPSSFLLLLLFFGWAMLTVWIRDGYPSLAGLQSFSKSWNFVPYLAMPFGAAASSSERRLLRALGVCVLVGSAVIVLGALQYGTGLHYFFEGWFHSGPLVEGQRFTGFQSHPLHSAGLYTILLMAALAMTLFHRGEVPGRRFWGLCSLVLAIGVLLSGSRSYYIASAAGAGALLAARGWKFLLAGLFVSCFAVFMLTRFDAHLARRFQTIDPRSMDESGRQRIFIWKCAAMMIRDHPWTGVGYRKWRENIASYSERLPSWGQKDPAIFAHAHNSYLTVAAETGLPGLALFLSFWFCLFKEGWERLRSFDPGSLGSALAFAQSAAILSLMAAAFFEHNLLTATVVLALSFIAGLSVSSAEFPEPAS
jgi:O-antigen ligase